MLACSRGDRRATQRYQRLRPLHGTKPGEEKIAHSFCTPESSCFVRRTTPKSAIGTTLTTPSRQDVTRTHHTQASTLSSPPRRNIRTRVAPYANTDNERTSLHTHWS